MEISDGGTTGGMTRSRRIFSPKALRNKEPTPAKKEKTIESPKRTVMEEEARELLKVLDKGKNHNQPLHIAVKCESYMIARMLIDNGSSLNIMPKTTLDKLYSPGAILRNNPVVVKAFDGSKREVMGKITLPICMRPTTFDITFQVMDI
ncbi:hypothetical protein CR513_24675, partial [Mucuna pruriens]